MGLQQCGTCAVSSLQCTPIFVFLDLSIHLYIALSKYSLGSQQSIAGTFISLKDYDLNKSDFFRENVCSGGHFN